MFIPHEGPGTWQSFLKRKDNVGLPIMEARQKYLKEQLLFENYVSTLQTLNTVSTAAAGAAGGPAPSTGGGGGGGVYDIEFKINTAYNIPNGANNVSNPSTQVQFTQNIYDASASYPAFDGEITVDWGDGTVESFSDYNATWTKGARTAGLVRHTYSTDGEYTIKIKGTGSYKTKFAYLPITEIIKYDPTQNTDWRGLFFSVPTPKEQFVSDISTWDASGATSLEFVFGYEDPYGYQFIAFASEAKRRFFTDVSGWVTPNNTSLKWAFRFNYGLSTESIPWNTSNVTTVEDVFTGTPFWQGGGLDSWDFTNVTDVARLRNVNPYLNLPFPDSTAWGTWPALGNTIPNNDTSFPQFDLSAFSQYAPVWYSIPWTKANIGNTAISWANNPSLPSSRVWEFRDVNQVVSRQYYDTTGVSTDFNFTGDPAVASALTTLQGAGWTLVGFTF